MVDDYYEDCITEAANSCMDKLQLLSVHLSVAMTIYESFPGSITPAQSKKLAELHDTFAAKILCDIRCLH
jgi:hypothetical protein